jgi:HK97 family phage prohead protease
MQMREKTTRCVKTFAFEIKATGERGEVEGYGSVFNNEDSWGDIVAPGAFKRSLEHHRSVNSMPAMLWQHDQNDPIGVWTSMEEDQYGLRIKGKIVMGTQRGAEAFELLKAGAIRGLSIGFTTQKYAYDEKSDVRTVLDVDLWEVSLVTFPANPEAQVMSIKQAVDEIDSPRDAERALRDAGFSKSAATTFVSRLMQFGEGRRDADLALKSAHKSAEKLLKTLSQRNKA